MEEGLLLLLRNQPVYTFVARILMHFITELRGAPLIVNTLKGLQSFGPDLCFLLSIHLLHPFTAETPYQ